MRAPTIGVALSFTLAACREHPRFVRYLHYYRNQLRPDVIDLIAGASDAATPLKCRWATALWTCVTNSLPFYEKLPSVVDQVMRMDPDVIQEDEDEDDLAYAQQIYAHVLRLRRKRKREC